jgi:hypothetical protein
MKLPEYISASEVRRVCKELGIRDWSRLKAAKALPDEASKILALVNTEKMNIDVDEFLAGLNVELEHGTRFKDANVTNNHPIVTGMIVLAHLKECLYYYKLLEVAELGGDVAAAIGSGDAAKIKKEYKKLARAKIVLAEAELKALK